jgi:hypothetical protein
VNCVVLFVVGGGECTVSYRLVKSRSDFFFLPWKSRYFLRDRGPRGPPPKLRSKLAS